MGDVRLGRAGLARDLDAGDRGGRAGAALHHAQHQQQEDRNYEREFDKCLTAGALAGRNTAGAACNTADARCLVIDPPGVHSRYSVSLRTWRILGNVRECRI